MSERRIGLREVRSLKSGQTIWDAAVAGFGARRQRSQSVAYVLFYRTEDGRSWYTIGGMARRGRLIRPAQKPSGCLGRSRTVPTQPP